MSELKPCPFCGTSDVDIHGWYDGEGCVGPECIGCGATARNVDDWNQRSSLSFALFREANNKRQLEWPGYEHTDTTFKALEVCGEAGELAEAIKKLTRAERGIAGTTASLESVADELADVIISADLLAAHLGIDLAKATAAKFNKTSRKYSLQTLLDEGIQ